MARKIPRVLWIAAPAVFLSCLYRLSAVGLIGPDEPRYASIAREMARSGDWITPRLYGLPWFEKPPLLYWMSGIAFRLGLGSELAPRLPVVLLAIAFLCFYWWILNREFGCRVATLAALILATCGGWLGFSQSGVTDLPLTATFSAAMLLALPWVSNRDPRYLPVASGLLGLAVLAKSGVPIVLALPLLWWFRPSGAAARPPIVRMLAPFLVVAVPWHVLCYLRNGSIFPYTLFVEHQFQRLTTNALQHVQPWWYYLPIVIALLLPWSPLLLLLARRSLLRDPRRQFLIAWVVFGLIFFSVATNKLPGYVLPLIPALAILMALALDEIPRASLWLAACAVLLVVFLVAAPVLPAAIAGGLSRAPRPAFQWTWLLPAVVAATAWILDRRSLRVAAAGAIAAGALAGMLYIKQTAAEQLDRQASARAIWLEIAARTDQVCADNLRRNFRYSLDYYTGIPLPECSEGPRPLRLSGQPPVLVASPVPGTTSR